MSILTSKISLVVVGDSNSDFTIKTITTFKESIPKEVPYQILVAPFDKDKGYNAALNEGAKKAEGKLIVFANNDLIFTPHWFGNMIAAFMQDHVASASPWCGLTHHQWWGDQKPSNPVQGYEVGKIIAGWCLVLRRSTYDAIGGFDERLKFWCCDNSYAKQIQNLGLKHWLVPTSRVDHLQSQTLNRLGKSEYDMLTKQEVRKYNKLYNENLFNLGVA